MFFWILVALSLICALVGYETLQKAPTDRSLIALSTICACIGISSLIEETYSVGIVAMGCWLGIMYHIRGIRP